MVEEITKITEKSGIVRNFGLVHRYSVDLIHQLTECRQHDTGVPRIGQGSKQKEEHTTQFHGKRGSLKLLNAELP